MPVSYPEWLRDVRDVLSSINMPIEDWQRNWAFRLRR